MALAGGTPRTVIELPDQIQGATWGPDNRIVYGFGTALFAVSADGGEPEQVTSGEVEDGVLGYRWPHLVAGTDVLLYTRWRGSIATSDVVARSLGTGEEQRLVDGSGAQYTASGHIVFGRGTELWAASFDPDQLGLTGPAVRLVEDLLTFSRGGAANFAITAGGALFYVSTSLGIEGLDMLLRVDRDGGNPTPVHTDALLNPRHLQLSPDGQRLVLVTGPIALGEIWIHPIDGRPPRPLRQEGQNEYPVWTHDGTRVVFASEPNAAADLVWLPSDGSSTEPEPLLEGPNRYYPSAWVPQRNELIFGQDTPAGQTRWDLHASARCRWSSYGGRAEPRRGRGSADLAQWTVHRLRNARQRAQGDQTPTSPHEREEPR